MKKYIAEFVGTFALVFCGTGAVIINQQTGGQVSNVGIAITFGLIITAMIYTFGETSGAHFNPAVTLGFYTAGLFNAKEIFPYIASQVVGAIAASGLLKLLFPENLTLGTTLPSGSPMQSFILECVLGFLLMLVILFTSQGSKEIGVMAGIAIGSTILLEAMFAGPISGASMNPARSLAPAIVSGNLTSLWVYLTAPIVGAMVATLVFRITREDKSIL
ncbi:MAG: MIP/aquaporin family protein [Bacteroidia bacterium]